MADNNGMETKVHEKAGSELITETEMAALLKVHPCTLQKWRREGRGPKYLRLGNTPRARIRYVRELP